MNICDVCYRTGRENPSPGLVRVEREIMTKPDGLPIGGKLLSNEEAQRMGLLAGTRANDLCAFHAEELDLFLRGKARVQVISFPEPAEEDPT